MVTGVVYSCPACGGPAKGCVLDQLCMLCSKNQEISAEVIESANKLRDESQRKQKSILASLETKPSSRFQKLKCKLGIHSFKTVTLYLGLDSFSKEPLNINYSICQFCLEGHPILTGEW